MDTILRTAVAKDFWWFVSKAFSHLEGTKLEDQHYLRYMCSMLEQLEQSKIRRLIVNAPPRHLKTFICSICFIAWSLGRNPALRVILVSYNENFADDIVSPIHELMNADWYRKAFPKFRVDKASRSVIKTTKGGILRPASRSGTLTGHGADLIVIDDPTRSATSGGLTGSPKTLTILGTWHFHV
jgi:hypothetical protein